MDVKVGLLLVFLGAGRGGVGATWMPEGFDLFYSSRMASLAPKVTPSFASFLSLSKSTSRAQHPGNANTTYLTYDSNAYSRRTNENEYVADLAVDI